MKPRSILSLAFGYLIACVFQIAGLARCVERLPDDRMGIGLYVATIVLFGLGAVVYLFRWASEMQSVAGDLSSNLDSSPGRKYTIVAEWNDSLAGDYLWSNVNFGEAVTEVMTPLSWSVLRLVLEDWAFLPGSHPVANIGGRPYLNISIFASVLTGLGKSKQDMSRALEGLLFMRLPEGLEIPLIPLSRRSLLRALPNLIQMQIRQKSGVRNLPAYVAKNPARCANMQQQIQAARDVARSNTMW